MTENDKKKAKRCCNRDVNIRLDEYGYVIQHDTTSQYPDEDDIPENENEYYDDVETTNNLEWMKEYSKLKHKRSDNIYDNLPYINIDILIDLAMEEGKGIGYVTYGVEVYLRQQMSWLAGLWEGSECTTYSVTEDNNRFYSVVRSIGIYTDFLSYVIEELSKE